MNPETSTSLLTTIKSTTRAFRLGLEGEGSKQLTASIDLLSQLMPDLPAATTQKLTPWLQSTLNAISRRDYLWAADMLDYEIIPLLNGPLATPTDGGENARKAEHRGEGPLGQSSSTLSCGEVTFELDWGVYCILQLLQEYQFDQVLDIGSGAGEHKKFLEFFGKKVFSVDLVNDADYVGDFMDIKFDGKFDVIWCSHVLEHQRNIGLFLDKLFDVLKDGGILALSVPIHPRERLISGHLSSWSISLLCYNLIMAGFDCKEARIIETFELSIIVQKRLAPHKELRKSSAHGADAGVEFADIKAYFPFDASQGAEICGPGTINWDNMLDYSLPEPIHPGISEIKISSKNFKQEPELTPSIKLIKR